MFTLKNALDALAKDGINKAGDLLEAAESLAKDRFSTDEPTNEQIDSCAAQALVKILAENQK